MEARVRNRPMLQLRPEEQAAWSDHPSLWALGEVPPTTQMPHSTIREAQRRMQSPGAGTTQCGQGEGLGQLHGPSGLRSLCQLAFRVSLNLKTARGKAVTRSTVQQPSLKCSRPTQEGSAVAGCGECAGGDLGLCLDTFLVIGALGAIFVIHVVSQPPSHCTFH